MHGFSVTDMQVTIWLWWKARDHFAACTHTHTYTCTRYIAHKYTRILVTHLSLPNAWRGYADDCLTDSHYQCKKRQHTRTNNWHIIGVYVGDGKNQALSSLAASSLPAAI